MNVRAMVLLLQDYNNGYFEMYEVKKEPAAQVVQPRMVLSLSLSLSRSLLPVFVLQSPLLWEVYVLRAV